MSHDIKTQTNAPKVKKLGAHNLQLQKEQISRTVTKKNMHLQKGWQRNQPCPIHSDIKFKKCVCWN